MSWSTPIPALPYEHKSEEFAALISPTTAVRINLYASGVLRMYVPFYSDLLRSAQDIVRWPDVEAHADLIGGLTELSAIAILDSDVVGAFQVPDHAAPTLTPTWLANEREIDAWRLDRVTHYGTWWNTTTDDRIRSIGLEPKLLSTATYSEPCIVDIPDAQGGGWLMLLARRRTVRGLFSGETAYQAEYDMDGKELENADLTTIGDIVAYWSPTLDFREGTVGAVLLVDSLEALPDVNFRVWLGVPGAVLTTNPENQELCLYVYYAVEVPYHPHLRCEVNPDGRTTYEQAVHNAGYEDYRLNRRGFIGVKRIPWDNLLRTLHPDCGLYEPLWKPGDAITGDLLGRARIWLPLPTRGFHARAIDFLDAFRDTVQRVTDPEPESCDESLSLFFTGFYKAVGPDDPPVELSWRNGHGVWRAAAMPSGVSLLATQPLGGLETSASLPSPEPGSISLPPPSSGRPTTIEEPVLTEFGRDFVVAAYDGDRSGPDLVAGAFVGKRPSPPTATARRTGAYSGAFSTGPDGPGVPWLAPEQHTPADADAVRFNGQWHVFLGGFSTWEPLNRGQSSAWLARVIGDEDDGCRSWEEAWRFAEEPEYRDPGGRDPYEHVPPNFNDIDPVDPSRR